MPHPQDSSSFLFGANATFAQELYARFQQDPNSVDASWRELFKGLGDDAKTVLEDTKGAPWHPRGKAIIGVADPEVAAVKANGKAVPAAATGNASEEQIRTAALMSVRALMLIRAYRVRGHLHADLDPLHLEKPTPHSELEPVSYGFTEEDYDTQIFLGGVLGLQYSTLRDILGILQSTYCGTIGVEFMHIQHTEQKAWIQERIEVALGHPPITNEERKKILRDLIEVEAFEQFLQVKYAGTKRFSIQGGDATIAGLQMAIFTAARHGVEEVVMGMPHRGRMNVLTTIMGMPYLELLALFQGNAGFPEGINSSGDVKYHIGVSSDKTFDGKKVHLSLAANPSHLEAVNPVVLGKARAKQDQKKDTDRSRVMPILLHGDAAFAGQGSVPEALAFVDLKGYRTGGTLHIIVNNQIGFTTSPIYSRSTPYPTDVAKAVQAPIFHVNGDDPEAVAFVCKLAAEFRQQFHRDVVVDIVCYRKYGHNESDEPSFTQPKMYAAIGKKQLPAAMYADKLIAQGVMTKEEVDGEYTKFRAGFDKDFDTAKTFKPNKADWLEGVWQGFESPKSGALAEQPEPDTGVDAPLLTEVGHALSRNPENINVNKKIVRQLEAKRQAIDTGNGIDWATGEALAFGTLLKQGYPVRLSGQDSGRGTFSQRHSVLVDQTTEERYIPLNNLGGSQERYEVIDSNLSEFCVLGYEYGYSLSEPKALTLWEAQFGDFANGAQVIIDQFISSGEIKWLRMSGLVMLLPHGYEGQGPEHSSARLERYLQLCGQDNMIVADCTTPANYFHILRRQLMRNFRKPLVIMTPKSLLRHKLAVSKLDDFKAGTTFKPVISEVSTIADAKKVKRLIFCTGKVYYDLFETREEQKLTDTAIVRVEQLYPFPAQLVAAEIKKYPNAEIVWCQEEPKNMGAFTYISPRIEDTVEQVRGKLQRLRYAGRAEAASPAVGYLKVHEREQRALVEEALGISNVTALKPKQAGR